MAQDRPSIPAEIARVVRQRCGFGCILCGCPVYQAHHIDEWSEVREHQLENLTLLCGSHHEQHTKGIISKDTILQANNDPVNRRNMQTGPLELPFEGPNCYFNVGGNVFGNRIDENFAAIVIDMVPILAFGFESGQPLLYLQLFDEFNRPYLVVDAGFLVVTTSVWDITFKQNTLTLRDGPGKFRLEIVFNPPHEVHITRGLFLLNGVAAVVTPTSIKCLNNIDVTLKNCTFDSPLGLLMGAIPDDVGGPFRIRKINRYPHLALYKYQVLKKPQT